MRTTVLLVSFSLFLIRLAPAATVEIQYSLTSGGATVDPFSIPDPNGGADFTISPSLSVESGSFTAVFQSDASGIISDGDAEIVDFQFIGGIDIEISTIVTVIFPVTVTANLVGPLGGVQVSDSSGTLAGATAYIETGIGNYDTVAGPIDCEDSLFGIACTGIETALGITFPLAEVSGDDAPLPFTGGTFSDLNGTSPSSAGNTLDLAVPIDDTTNFGFAVEFVWAETGRALVIPEPGAPALMLIGSLSLLRRRRR